MGNTGRASQKRGKRNRMGESVHEDGGKDELSLLRLVQSCTANKGLRKPINYIMVARHQAKQGASSKQGMNKTRLHTLA